MAGQRLCQVADDIEIGKPVAQQQSEGGGPLDEQKVRRYHPSTQDRPREQPVPGPSSTTGPMSGPIAAVIRRASDWPEGATAAIAKGSESQARRKRAPSPAGSA